MKLLMAILMGAILLPLMGCGKKSDVVPPPGYQMPPHKAESK
jgi:hypothetical protein